MIKNKEAQGFAMIEVLLAVVILAIGLLAGSRMQILGLNFTQGAMTRSYATLAANDIIDRMRLNRVAAIAGEYDSTDTRSTIPTNPNCTAIGCDAAGLAATDLNVWGRYFGLGDAQDTSTLLPPGAYGTISTPDANGMRTVRIIWSDFIDGQEDAIADQRSIQIGVVL